MGIRALEHFLIPPMHFQADQDSVTQRRSHITRLPRRPVRLQRISLSLDEQGKAAVRVRDFRRARLGEVAICSGRRRPVRSASAEIERDARRGRLAFSRALRKCTIHGTDLVPALAITS